MSKSLYILILLLIGISFWNIKPFGSFLTPDVSIILFLFWGFWGFNKYKSHNYKMLCNYRYNKPIVLFFIAILISFIPAYIYHGQSLVMSISVNRQLIGYLSLPLLLVVRPSFEELKKAMYWFSYLYVMVVVLDSVLSISVIDRSMQFNNFDEREEYIGESDFVRMIDGIQFIVLSLIFSLNDLKQRFKFKTLLLATFFLFIIYIVQNRSTLFPSVILYVVTLFSLKSGKYNFFIKGLLLAFMAVMISVTASQWVELFEETQNQMGDEDYNRMLAYAFFLTQYSPHWICDFIGNGFISAKSSDIMQSLMEDGIYNSDVGFVGFWNHFGLLPIIVMLSLIIKSFYRKVPYVVKCNAFFLFACSLTIAYFVQLGYILWLCLYIYMYSYSHSLNHLKSYEN